MGLFGRVWLSTILICLPDATDALTVCVSVEERSPLKPLIILYVAYLNNAVARATSIAAPPDSAAALIIIGAAAAAASRERTRI
eukprot:SAG31_NODE_1324_length_8789_cov_2.736249_8_plen_84_part_00